ncbi:hypothetical protein [Bacteroides sp. RTP21281st1_E4_RTP21281_210402]|uniref:hypothetical protein n=1 Tax=unclassified Bacteroides TaxID=2646097 RepID=UPI0034A27212
MSDIIINTGMQRATELTVSKEVGGVSVTGYPRIYKLGDSFGNNAAMTSKELAEISIEAYQARLTDFAAYVESIEIGISIDISEAYRENLTVCPI